MTVPDVPSSKLKKAAALCGIAVAMFLGIVGLSIVFSAFFAKLVLDVTHESEGWLLLFVLCVLAGLLAEAAVLVRIWRRWT